MVQRHNTLALLLLVTLVCTALVAATADTSTDSSSAASQVTAESALSGAEAVADAKDEAEADNNEGGFDAKRKIRTHERHRERIRHDHIARLLHQEHREATKQNVTDAEEVKKRMKSRYEAYQKTRHPGRDDESHLGHGADYEEYDEVREHLRDKHSRYNIYLGYYMFEAKYKLRGEEANFEDCFDRANQWSHRLESLTDVPCEVVPRNRETLLITVRDVSHGPYVEELVRKFDDCLSIQFKTKFDPPKLR